MQFGVFVTPKIDDWQLIKYAEELGFHSAWVPDSQMIWSDCYATLALAAHNTSRIRLGTGVAIPGTRIAPVTAHSIASINRLAPGRVFLGIGTGHTAMRLMGMAPMRMREFREYLRVVRALLRGEEVEYTLNGVTVYFTEFCQAFHAKAATWFTRRLPPWERVRRSRSGATHVRSE